MTDHFAILEQPRRPWLDENALREKFHQLARRAHPDHSHGTSAEFAQLSEAFRVLSDPKMRLRHLLELEEKTAPSDENILPKDLEELFPKTNAAIQNADDLRKKTSETTNALSRSLLNSEVIATQKQIAQSLAELSELYGQTISQLRALDESWTTVSARDFSELRSLYLKIGYLSRWIAQLEEKKVQFSLS